MCLRLADKLTENTDILLKNKPLSASEISSFVWLLIRVMGTRVYINVCVCVCVTYILNIAWRAVGSSWAAHLSEPKPGPHLKKDQTEELLKMDEVKD